MDFGIRTLSLEFQFLALQGLSPLIFFPAVSMTLALPTLFEGPHKTQNVTALCKLKHCINIFVIRSRKDNLIVSRASCCLQI